MIVEPDFLSHWKTQLLINDLNDRCAPLYVIALWAHCQQRRSDSFTNLAPNALKAICRYEGEASKLRSALERCGFLDVEGEAVVVHGWAELNAKLIANWDNGKTGGRPRNPDSRRSRSGQYSEEPKPNRNPTETESGKTETQPEPIRVEEIRDDNRERDSSGVGIRRPTLAQAKSAASQIGVTPEMADEWWNAREASDWMKGTGGGGTTPIGSNWQADLKTYASRMGSSKRPATPSESKPKRLAWE